MSQQIEAKVIFEEKTEDTVDSAPPADPRLKLRSASRAEKVNSGPPPVIEAAGSASVENKTEVGSGGSQDVGGKIDIKIGGDVSSKEGGSGGKAEIKTVTKVKVAEVGSGSGVPCYAKEFEPVKNEIKCLKREPLDDRLKQIRVTAGGGLRKVIQLPGPTEEVSQILQKKREASARASASAAAEMNRVANADSWGETAAADAFASPPNVSNFRIPTRRDSESAGSRLLAMAGGYNASPLKASGNDWGSGVSPADAGWGSSFSRGPPRDYNSPRHTPSNVAHQSFSIDGDYRAQPLVNQGMLEELEAFFTSEYSEEAEHINETKLDLRKVSRSFSQIRVTPAMAFFLKAGIRFFESIKKSKMEASSSQSFSSGDSFNFNSGGSDGGGGGRGRGRGRGGGGGGGGRACFKCGEEGHFSRECPNGDSNGNGGGGRGGGRGGRGGGRGGRGSFGRRDNDSSSGWGGGSSSWGSSGGNNGGSSSSWGGADDDWGTSSSKTNNGGGSTTNADEDWDTPSSSATASKPAPATTNADDDWDTPSSSATASKPAPATTNADDDWDTPSSSATASKPAPAATKADDDWGTSTASKSTDDWGASDNKNAPKRFNQSSSRGRGGRNSGAKPSDNWGSDDWGSSSTTKSANKEPLKSLDDWESSSWQTSANSNSNSNRGSKRGGAASAAPVSNAPTDSDNWDETPALKRPRQASPVPPPPKPSAPADDDDW